MPINLPGIIVDDDGNTIGRFSRVDFNDNLTVTIVDGIAIIDAASGASAEIPIENEGSQITATVTSIDFVGAGVLATAAGNDVTVTIPGSDVGVLASRPAAAAANEGMLWYASDVDLAYISDGATWTTLVFSSTATQETDDNAFFYALALG